VLARQPNRARKLLTRTQTKLLDDGRWHANVLGHGKKIQLRPAQPAKGVARLLEKPLRRDSGAGLQSSTDKIDKLIMARARRVEAEIQLARARLQLIGRKPLQLVQT